MLIFTMLYLYKAYIKQIHYAFFDCFVFNFRVNLRPNFHSAASFREETTERLKRASE